MILKILLPQNLFSILFTLSLLASNSMLASINNQSINQKKVTTQKSIFRKKMASLKPKELVVAVSGGILAVFVVTYYLYRSFGMKDIENSIKKKKKDRVNFHYQSSSDTNDSQVEPVNSPQEPIKSGSDTNDSQVEPVNSPQEPIKSGSDTHNSPIEPVNSLQEPIKSGSDTNDSQVEPVNSPQEPIKASSDTNDSQVEPVNSPQEPIKPGSDTDNIQVEPVNSLKQPKTLTPPQTLPQRPTKKEIDAFYDLNQDYFDLDMLIPKQKNWQLDDSKGGKIDQWVDRMEKAWDNLSSKTKSSWVNYWVKRQQKFKKDWKKKKMYYEGSETNILSLFAQDYKKRLIENFVTWKKFKEQIEVVGKEAAKKMESKDWEAILFLVPGGMEKSNPWTFFVFWKYLKEHIPSSAKCHFISHKKTYDINSKNQAITWLLQNTNYSDQDSLVFIFDDMAYSGKQIKKQLNYFDLYNSYPSNLYIIIPYLTHTGKRRITGMDPSTDSPQFYNYDYFTGEKGHYKNGKKEKEWFKETPVKFMESTKVIQEIFIKKGFLGSDGSITTPTALPFKIADNISVLSAVIAYGIYPMKEELTKKEINQFDPMSLFKDHAYTDDEKTDIRNKVFTEMEEGGTIFEQEIPDEFPNELLPIKAFYKNHTFTFQVKENNEIVQKKYSNKHSKELKGRGIFEAIKELLTQGNLSQEPPKQYNEAIY